MPIALETCAENIVSATKMLRKKSVSWAANFVSQQRLPQNCFP
jgi:hypothetical protein